VVKKRLRFQLKEVESVPLWGKKVEISAERGKKKEGIRSGLKKSGEKGRVLSWKEVECESVQKNGMKHHLKKEKKWQIPIS
jgi:hypothetical protein